MKGPISTLVLCLALVLAAAGYGLWERHIGAQQAEARARADSLLNVSILQQDSIRRTDSLSTERGRVVRDSLSARLRALQRVSGASQRKADSLTAALGTAQNVPRMTVDSIVGAFRGVVAQQDSTIATLAADTLFLVGRIAQKDSTIAALNHSLDGERQQLATALRPHSPGILSRGFDLATKTLALYGLGKLVFH